MTVTVYTTQTCPWCQVVKQHLTKNGVSFVEKDVSRDMAAAQEMVKKSGQMGVPVTDVNGQIVVGFNEQLLNKLVIDA